MTGKALPDRAPFWVGWLAGWSGWLLQFWVLDLTNRFFERVFYKFSRVF